MTNSGEEVIQLLREIRDDQREQIARYREVTQRSLDAQQTAIEIQRRASRLYRIVLAVAAVLVAGLIFYLHSLPI